jgi:hypothetical protein
MEMLRCTLSCALQPFVAPATKGWHPIPGVSLAQKSQPAFDILRKTALRRMCACAMNKNSDGERHYEKTPS